MPRKASAAYEIEPRPTRAAFKPAGKEDLQADLMLAGVCLAGFFLGLGANLWGNFWGFLNATERGINNSLTPFPLQMLVYFGFPLFLAASVYFLWHAWNHRRKSIYFQKHHVRAEALITHLWKVPPSGSGKRSYVGYRYLGDYAVYLQIDVYQFKRLQVGESIPVDYLPEDPWVSCPVLTGHKA